MFQRVALTSRRTCCSFLSTAELVVGVDHVAHRFFLLFFFVSYWRSSCQRVSSISIVIMRCVVCVRSFLVKTLFYFSGFLLVLSAWHVPCLLDSLCDTGVEASGVCRLPRQRSLSPNPIPLLLPKSCCMYDDHPFRNGNYAFPQMCSQSRFVRCALSVCCVFVGVVLVGKYL